MISLTLKLFSGSVVSPGMLNGALSVLFPIFCAENKFKHGNPMESDKYKNKYGE